jgi:hypothetical protein
MPQAMAVNKNDSLSAHFPRLTQNVGKNIAPVNPLRVVTVKIH